MFATQGLQVLVFQHDLVVHRHRNGAAHSSFHRKIHMGWRIRRPPATALKLEPNVGPPKDNGSRSPTFAHVASSSQPLAMG
jgi:hypothetical protein